jgi:tetratricopeptide (TPR) repeat protein
MKARVRHSIAACSLALVPLLTPLSLHAHGAPNTERAPLALATTVTGWMQLWDTAATDARLERANQLYARGRITQARKEYLSVAKRLDAEHRFAKLALWRAAELYFVEGDSLRAARTLDQVAEKAAAFGDPITQAQALLEAGILYEQLGLDGRAADRRQRLDAVLTSPVLPDSVRVAINMRRR